jgi:hypothetical protein
MLAGRRQGPEGEEASESPAALAQPAAKIVAPSGAEAPVPKAQSRESLLRYRRGIQSLISQYVPKGATIDATLSQLAEKWNPLFGSTQKRNLVEDVNALIRDFIRPIRRSFLVRPPDLQRIHGLAVQLAESQSLGKIKKREQLLRYIELYMVRCLQVKQL